MPVLNTHETGYVVIPNVAPDEVGAYVLGYVKEGVCFRADYDKDQATLTIIATGGY